MSASRPDFSAAHQILRDAVERRILPGVSALVLRDGQVIDQVCMGKADLESGEDLRPDHLHRAFSNTKLVTSTLALMLHDAGCFGLDDPVKQWIPELGMVRVLRKGADRIDDTVPLEKDITIRHLLSHQSGLSHGVFDPGTTIYKAYHASGARLPNTTLAELMSILGGLPLLFQPGDGWEYSMATDVLARLAEIHTGQRFDEALRTRLFDPLGMKDTRHVVSAEQAPRLAAIYRGANDAQPNLPGLTRADNIPWPGAHLQPVARIGGVSGLVTTQADVAALLNGLMSGRLLKPATLDEMTRDQVPSDRSIQFFHTGAFPELGFGLGGAVNRGPSRLQPNTPVGEFQWGGVAGTHWTISRETGIALVLMTQRWMGFWNPFWFAYKQAAYAALAGGR